MEGGPVLDVVEVKWLAGTKNGGMFWEVAVMWVVEAVYNDKFRAISCWLACLSRLTIDKLTRQHFDLSRPLAPIAELFRGDQRIWPVLLVNVFGRVTPFRPKHAIVLWFALGWGSSGQKCAGLSRNWGWWPLERLTGWMAKKLPEQLVEDGRVHDAEVKDQIWPWIASRSTRKYALCNPSCGPNLII